MRILGVDEVGRGSIAGPLVVGAVLLERPIKGLKDSKLLTRKQRSQLAIVIQKRALFYSLGWVSSAEVDRIGLTKSLFLAADRALEGFSFEADKVLLDGNYNYLPKRFFSETIIGGDKSVPAISAASILAKVARDSYMINLAKDFPLYGFNDHVGYCTKRHMEALFAHGSCIHHRKSFEPVKSFLLGSTLKQSQDPAASIEIAR